MWVTVRFVGHADQSDRTHPEAAHRRLSRPGSGRGEARDRVTAARGTSLSRADTRQGLVYPSHSARVMRVSTSGSKRVERSLQKGLPHELVTLRPRPLGGRRRSGGPSPRRCSLTADVRRQQRQQRLRSSETRQMERSGEVCAPDALVISDLTIPRQIAAVGVTEPPGQQERCTGPHADQSLQETPNIVQPWSTAPARTVGPHLARLVCLSRDRRRRL